MDWFGIALLSAVLSAIAAILQKRALNDMGQLEFSFLLSAAAAAFSLPFVFTDGFTVPGTAAMLVLAVKSVINAAAFLCIMTALRHLDISRALPIMAISPMIIALLAFVFLGEWLKPVEIAGMLLIAGGTYFLELKKGEGPLHPFRVLSGSKYHRYLFAALALISVSSVLDKAILSNFKVPPQTFLVFQNLFFFVIFFVMVVAIKGRGNLTFDISKKVLLIILIAAVITVLYRWSQFEATKIAPVGLVISVKRLSVLFASIAGARIFREGSYLQRGIAVAMIVAGAMLIWRD